jgi:predicted metal-dependent HD superfamily phosphohydrolase
MSSWMCMAQRYEGGGVDDGLRERWMQLTGLLGVDPADAIRVLRDLWRRYDEPQRAYHRMPHVRHVLEVFDALRADEPVDDPVGVQLAAWFHDAIYDPGAPDNEERSAALAEETLTTWAIAPERRSHVGALIRATAKHPVTDVDPDTALLVDADLAILAADPDTYDVYRRAVRVEYGHMDQAHWRAGRAAFLRALLARPAVYATATMRRRGDAAARRNLAAELADLD